MLQQVVISECRQTCQVTHEDSPAAKRDDIPLLAFTNTLKHDTSLKELRRTSV